MTASVSHTLQARPTPGSGLLDDVDVPGNVPGLFNRYMTSSNDPKQTVRLGYDAVSLAYRKDEGDASHDYLLWVTRALGELGDNPSVLELGCGCGVPVAAAIAPHARYTGVDLSPVQIDRARSLVPAGRFRCADMTELRFERESFDAVIAFYSIIHLPVDEHAGLIRRIGRWLRPGGVFVATLGHTACTGEERDWLGVPDATMFWSHADAPTYRRWIEQSGLVITVDEFIPEGQSGHQLFQARR